MPDKDEILELNNRDIQMVLQLQQERFQHLQSLSQGLLTGGITAVAVVVTVVTAIFSQLPTITTNQEVVSDAASSVPVIQISNITASLTIFLGVLLAIVYLMLSGFMFLSGLWKLLDVATNRSISPDLLSNRLILPEIRFTGIDDMDSGRADFEIAGTVNQNREVLSLQYKQFLNGALRIPVGLVLGFLAYSFYFYAASELLVNLLVLSVATSLPAIVNIDLLRLGMSGTELESQIPSLADELMMDDRAGSRWDEVELQLPEKVLNGISTLLSLLLVLMWILAAIID